MRAVPAGRPPVGKPGRPIPSKDVSPNRKGGSVMENLTLQDYIGLTLMLIAFATLVLKLYDSKKH